jgi:hypothetical protein
MRRLLFIVVCSALIGVGLLFASTASALEPSIEVGADYILETTVVEEASGQAAVRCRKITVGYTKTNGGIGPTSNDLYKIFQRQGWCWNTSTRKVTSLYGHERWKECCDPGWVWVGWEATTTSWGSGGYTVTRRIEGHTKFCPPFIGCMDHDHPFIKLYLNANGSYGVHKGS